jgi:hypothetical protein
MLRERKERRLRGNLGGGETESVRSAFPWRDSNGCVNVLSRHTTTAVTINEMEGRLVDDVRQYLVRSSPFDDDNDSQSTTLSRPYGSSSLHLHAGGAGEAGAARLPVPSQRHSSS